MDCSPPGSSIHGILQARILEWERTPGDLPDPGIEPGSPVLQADSLPSKPPVSSKLEMGVNLKRRLQVTSLGGGGKALFKISRELQFGICNCGKSLQGTGRRMLFSGEKKLGGL